MSLNIRKAKTINNFMEKLKNFHKIINNKQKSIKEISKKFRKDEDMLEYLQSFLTPRRPSLVKQSYFYIKNKNNNHHISTIQSKSEIRYPSNMKSNSIFRTKHNIIYRNNIYSQINTLENKTNSSRLSYDTINQKNYTKNLIGFSPKNRYKLMEIYNKLHSIKTPCLTKESNSKKTFKFFKSDNFHKIINSDLNNDYYNIDKSINNNKLKNNKKNNKIKDNNIIGKSKIDSYKIQNVNSLKFSKINKENIINNNITLKEKEDEIDLKEKNEIEFLSEKKNENINNHIINGYQNYIKTNTSEKNDVKINNTEYNKDVNKKVNEIINKIKEKDKNDNQENLNKYYKANIMENCLNKLFFDYSDGNYTYANNYNYTNDENINENIIINKEKLVKKVENIKPKFETDYLINDEKNINKNNFNQKLIENNFSEKVNLENKENINTENINIDKDIILSLDDEEIDSKNNQKKLNQNLLNKLKKINFNLNYLYENKNFVNIQLLHENPKRNPKQLINSKNDFFRNSKLIKKSKTNLKFLSDNIPKHENIKNEKYFSNSHSIENNKIYKQNFRKNKIFEYINKNSAIMPPNNYIPTSKIISGF